MEKIALITGINGQDGSYLAEFLLAKGYQVHGIHRRSSSNNLSRIEHIRKDLTLHEGDITDYAFMHQTMLDCLPDEIYNLAAQSHVQTSFKNPVYTGNVNYFGVLNILEILRRFPNLGLVSKCEYRYPKLYQASTSEMYGDSYTPIVDEAFTWKNVQNEKTPFNPQSPYAISKVAAHQACKLYREAHGVNVSCGILFNHESPRRGDEFVTKKITNYIKHLSHLNPGVHDNLSTSGWLDLCEGYESLGKLKLGNLDAKRDWGYAAEYVEVMWLMLQQDRPDDYVISTGETHTVREFLVEAASLIGVNNIFPFVEIDDTLKRPADVEYLCGDSYKANTVLGWKPTVKFKQLVNIMVNQ